MIKKEPAVNNVSFTQHLLHTTGYHQVRRVVFYFIIQINIYLVLKI